MTTAMKRRDFLRLSAIAAIEAGLLTFGLSRPALASPAEKEGLAYLTALEQIQYYREGKLSPVDVLTAQIQRIRKYNGPLNTSGEALKDHMKFNGQVNAITYEHFDQAMKAAKESEKRYKTGSARVLEGVTVAIKDENDVRGWRVTMGSIALKDAPPSKENAAIIDMLLSAGAVLHIQTTVPEFYIHGQTWVFRRVRGGSGRRFHHPGHGFGHGRVNPDSRVIVRTLWIQGAFRPCPHLRDDF